MNDCVVLTNKSTLEVLGLFNPGNSLWEERTTLWYIFFYLLIVIYCILFLGLALTCILLLIKRHLAQRFKVRTFIAIDLALVTLGLSRALFLLLDPWKQLGFCTHYVCTVFSRLLGSLGFPSLTASYTLVFLTLWISARINLGRSWVQRLKILIPLCFVHYVIAIIFEIIALVPLDSPMTVIVLLIVCEAIFSIWGLLVCVLFLIAGFRLLRIVEETCKSSSMICKDSPNLSRHDLIEMSKFKEDSTKQGEEVRKRSNTNTKLKNILKNKQRRALRKITLITYITVALGIIYSILSIINLIMLTLGVFNDCPGTQFPEVWLTLKYVVFTTEFSMALLLIYAISDCTPLINTFKKTMRRCCKSNENTNQIEDKNAIGKLSIVKDTTETRDSELSPHLTKQCGSVISPLSVSFSVNDELH